MGKENRFAISGTHCSGKTTLIEHFERDQLFLGISVIKGPTRKAQQQGLPINNDQTENYDITQFFCLIHDLNCLRRNNFISDRCILDTYVYTKYLYCRGLVSKPCYEIVEEQYERNLKFYSIIFLTDTELIPLTEDGVRNKDEAFREEINYLFGVEYSKYPYIIRKIKGTVGERIKIIETHL